MLRSRKVAESLIRKVANYIVQQLRDYATLRLSAKTATSRLSNKKATSRQKKDMKEYYFEKMEVWKEARFFVKEVYLLTNDFPAEEKFGMVSQIRRAALSISANIAEGMSRHTEKDKARFINQAYGSAIEVISFLVLGYDLQFLSEDKYITLREKLEKITNQLNALYKKFDR